MRLSGFTRFEIVFALVAVAILSYLAIPFYRTILEDSEAFVCEANLKALKASLDIYIIEHESFPSDLSQIPLPILQKAYTELMQKEGRWKVELAYFIAGFKQRGFAYAGLLTELAKEKPGVLRCPAAGEGEQSYGLWKGLAFGGPLYTGLNSKGYNALPEGQLLIGDCDAATFDSAWDLAQRHKRYFQNYKKATYAQAIAKTEVSTSVGGKTISGIFCEVSRGKLYSKGARKMMVFDESQAN